MRSSSSSVIIGFSWEALEVVSAFRNLVRVVEVVAFLRFRPNSLVCILAVGRVGPAEIDKIQESGIFRNEKIEKMRKIYLRTRVRHIQK